VDCAQWGKLGAMMRPTHQPGDALAGSKVAQNKVWPESDEAAWQHERFQLQVRLDIERERELLYKALLVVEVLALLFVMREILIRWLI
jgi:hypothetical protein